MSNFRLLVRHVGYVYVAIGMICLVWLTIQPHGIAVLGVTLGLAGLCCVAISFVLPRGRSR